MIKSALKYATLISLVALTTCGNWALDFDDDFAAAGASFSPLDIANCELWLDASDVSTLTMDGTAVTNFNDKSVNDYNFHSASTATAPTTLASGMNGRRSLVFNGVNQTLRGPDLGLNASDITVFCVIHCPVVSTAAKYQMVFCFNQHNTGLWGGRLITATKAFQVFNNSGYASLTSSMPYNSAADYLMSIVKDTGTSLKLYQDGVFLASGSNFAAYSAGVSQIGHMDSGLATAAYFVGQINEFIVYSSALSDSDRAEVETYLKNKWDI